MILYTIYTSVICILFISSHHPPNALHCTFRRRRYVTELISGDQNGNIRVWDLTVGLRQAVPGLWSVQSTRSRVTQSADTVDQSVVYNPVEPCSTHPVDPVSRALPTASVDSPPSVT
jgi:hypothetical protein